MENSEFKRIQKWDNRLLILARHVSTWSKDPSTKCGAVIARPDHTVVSLGYNGFPRGVPDLQELLDDRMDKYARVVHAEMNAILSSPERVKGYTMYVWPFATCERCAAHIIQAGISRVVWAEASDEEAQVRWAESASIAMEMYNLAGVQVSIIPVPTT